MHVCVSGILLYKYRLLCNKFSRSTQRWLPHTHTHTHTRFNSPWLCRTARLPFSPLPKMCQSFPPDVLYYVQEGHVRAESNNSSATRPPAVWAESGGEQIIRGWIDLPSFILLDSDSVHSYPFPVALTAVCAANTRYKHSFLGDASQSVQRK